jgi:hypothetical protein
MSKGSDNYRVLLITVVCILINIKTIRNASDFANPSFEYGVANGEYAYFHSMPGNWQTNDVIEVWGNNKSGYSPYNGLNFIELNADNNASTVYQILTLNQNTNYQLTWYMRTRTFRGYALSQSITLELNDVAVASYINQNNENWTLGKYTFSTGSITNWKIAFVGYSDYLDGSLGNLLDNVHVSEELIIENFPILSGDPSMFSPLQQPRRIDPQITKDWLFSRFGGRR